MHATCVQQITVWNQAATVHAAAAALALIENALTKKQSAQPVT
jgi:hypothetical protein